MTVRLAPERFFSRKAAAEERAPPEAPALAWLQTAGFQGSLHFVDRVSTHADFSRGRISDLDLSDVGFAWSTKSRLHLFSAKGGSAIRQALGQVHWVDPVARKESEVDSNSQSAELVPDTLLRQILASQRNSSKGQLPEPELRSGEELDAARKEIQRRIRGSIADLGFSAQAAQHDTRDVATIVPRTQWVVSVHERFAELMNKDLNLAVMAAPSVIFGVVRALREHIQAGGKMQGSWGELELDHGPLDSLRIRTLPRRTKSWFTG